MAGRRRPGVAAVAVLLCASCARAATAAGAPSEGGAHAAPATGGAGGKRAPWQPLLDSADGPLIERYLAVCRDLQVPPSADALVQLQLGSPNLTIRPPSGRPFDDLEMRALSMLLEDAEGAKLVSLRVLDLSACSLGPSGAMLVAHLLRHPRCKLETLDVSSQALGYAGAQALLEAVRDSRTMTELRLHSCDLGDEGGQLLVELLQSQGDGEGGRLVTINAENNFIGFETCARLIDVARLAHVELHLAGNRVLDEVFNAVSHGVGELLAIVASVFLCRQVRHKPGYYLRCSLMYCAALNTMFISSTLYHSFFALGHTVENIFGILDHSAIFLAIAGSYSPFLGILFHGEWWASTLLSVMWSLAIIGITLAAAYEGPHADALRVALYLTTGWLVVVCIRPMAQALGRGGTALLFLGGVLYTAGVPFFIRARHTFGIPDHTIWHIFVLMASGTHFVCVYWYVANRPARKLPGLDDGPEGALQMELEEQLVKPSAHGQDADVLYASVPALNPL